MQDFNCTQRPFVQIPGETFTRSPSEAIPIAGYEATPNFPDCCPFHQQAFEAAQKWFDKFPDCCKHHTEAVSTWHLKKSDYAGLPIKILNCLSYTEYHISQRLDIPEWYEDITNYIDYIWWSFGHPSIGIERYFAFLKNYLVVTKLPSHKSERLIQYIESLSKPGNLNEATKFDLNVIYDTFQKWVKIFPFELPYFKGLKEQYERKIPAFKEPARFNPYTGMAKARMVTQAELIDSIEVLTKRLISEVQTHDFQISDMKQHRLDLEHESLRVGTDELVKGYSKGELRYVTTIKKWLRLQKEYFRAVVEIAATDQKNEAPKKPISPPQFSRLFKTNEAMEKAIKAAQDCGLINENGKWVYIGAKTFAASAFWKAAVTAGLGKADIARSTVAKAVSEHFGIGLGKNAIGTTTGDYDADLYTKVLAAMRSM